MKRRLMSLMLAAVLLIGSSLTVSAAPQKMSDGNLFDAEYYAQQNPDVVAVLGKNTKTLYKHYLDYGRAEGRKATANDAGDTGFDAEFYAKTYPDVAAAVGTDAAALYQHYVNYGKAEGRKPSAGGTGASGFDAEFYARTYPDVAEALPDWYFLFAIFKNVDADVTDRNGVATHITHSVTQDEIDIYRYNARAFEEYMNSLGVMRAHVDVVEIDTPVTELYNEYSGGSYLSAELAAPLLKVDLDRYDHVTCILNLNVSTSYAGVAPAPFENGTGIACTNLNREDVLENYNSTVTHGGPHHLFAHEFIHFLEGLSRRFGITFSEHSIYENNYVEESKMIGWRNDDQKDILLNRAKGNDGTGVPPFLWQYPPHVMRTMTELTVPSGATSIGHDAFLNCTNLTSVTIPSGLTYLDVSAFNGCTSLANVILPSSLTKIEQWAFHGCAALTRISIPASVTSIGNVAFYNTGLTDVYYAGTEEQWKAIQIGNDNQALTNATIHYNSLMEDVKTSDWFAQGVTWALENGVTNGTDGGNFSPNATCNQAQIITFLWRAKGSPKPSGAVSGIEFYASAVQWAKEQGLIGGSFSPDAPCTRADVVTYLWKLAGCPKTGSTNFSDVPANASYAQAVAWAVEQGVTKGTSSTAFSPDAACTRGQIVTFLHRAMGK